MLNIADHARTQVMRSTPTILFKCCPARHKNEMHSSGYTGLNVVNAKALQQMNSGK
jgi:hypothetical protein